MTKATQTTENTGEAVLAELAALRVEDEARAARVRRIETLQLPLLDDLITRLPTLPLVEAITHLEGQAQYLTDDRQAVVINLIKQYGYTMQVIEADRERIAQQVEAEAAAAGASQ